MKVSLNWVRELSGVTTKTPELVELIGRRLGAVDETIDFGERYTGIVIAKVVECAKHPNADKLSVCKVDDKSVVKNVKRDSKGLVQVVCGAPNVKAGMLAVWIPPGAVVPSTFDKEPFKIEAKELRGVVSHGMLASASELGFGEDHSGLLELDGSAKAGASFAKAYGLDDTIIDIENKMFTHRPDCFGQLGVAREIAGITHKKFTSPGWYKSEAKLPPTRGGKKIEVKNDIPKLVPRFVAVVVDGVSVGPSPAWLQADLAKLGIKPINNVVDVTNYMMALTAQPLHAYDYDKLATATLGARLSKEGEELKLLGGKVIKLKSGSMVITDGKKPIGLAGVMGGADTETGETTKTIVLECASFDMNQTRKSAFEYGLFTDAATRFTKGQSPLQNAVVAARALELVQQLAGGKIGQAVDQRSDVKKTASLSVDPEFINTRLGLNLTASEMKRLLENVEFKVTAAGNNLKIEVPFWRTDIEIAEDIVEEVGRLWGYEHLPNELPNRDTAPTPLNPSIELKDKIREILSRAGANEVLTYSFAPKSLLEKSGQDTELAYKIANALSPDVQYYRLSLTPSLLDKVSANIKAGFDQFALFEIGKTHGKSEIDKNGLPAEMGRLALVVAGKNKSNGASFFWAKRYATWIAGELGQKLTVKPFDQFNVGGHKLAAQLIAPFEPSRSAWLFVDDKLAGIVGEYKQSVVANLKLPLACAGFEMFLSPLQISGGSNYRSINRFPALDQDITLRTPSRLSYQDLSQLVEAELTQMAKTHGYNWQLTPLGIFQKDRDDYHQISWRISLSHPERTLTTEEVNNRLNELSQAAKKLKAERI